MPQPIARNIYQFIENSVDDMANAVTVATIGAGAGVIWLAGEAAQVLRGTFGQDAQEIVGGLITVVIIGGVAYGLYRVRGGFSLRRLLRPPTSDAYRAERDGGPNPALPTQYEDDEIDQLTDTQLMMRNLIDAEHVLIVSGTGAGKTVFTTEIMRQMVQAGGKYYVLDGKPGMNWNAKWPLAARKIKDHALFVPALKTAVLDMERRIQHGAARFRPTYIVIDEASQVTGNYEEAAAAVADLSSRGREFNIHVWLTFQAATVKQAGFEGIMPILEHNFTAVELGKDDDGRYFKFARFRKGDIYSLGERYPIPNLAAPWADTSGLPIYDDRGEFVVDPSGANNGADSNAPQHTLRQSAPLTTYAQTEPAPVHAPVQNVLNMVKVLIDNSVGSTDIPYGKGWLSVGQAAAIFTLGKAEYSINEICDIVFGSKNQMRLEAVNKVLGL